MAEMTLGSVYLVKTFAELHSLTETAINDLIKNILQNPQFKVDTDILQCQEGLLAAIDSGDLDTISMRIEGDGA
jgi:hypothetical protein